MRLACSSEVEEQILGGLSIERANLIFECKLYFALEDRVIDASNGERYETFDVV